MRDIKCMILRAYVINDVGILNIYVQSGQLPGITSTASFVIHGRTLKNKLI